MQLYEWTFSDYYNRFEYRPAGDLDMNFYPDIVPQEWAHRSCTDCTKNGGSKKKPDFWPNDNK
jgi:hypothetical protein